MVSLGGQEAGEGLSFLQLRSHTPLSSVNTPKVGIQGFFTLLGIII